MAEQQIRKIVITTDNIIEMNELIRKAGQTTNEEIHASIKTTLNNWSGGKAQPQDNTGLFTINKATKLPEEDEENPSGRSTTVKIFLSSTESSLIEDALAKISANLHLSCLGTLIVVLPDISDDVTLESLQSMWVALEAAVEKGTVQSLGLADIPYRLLTELYEWAKIKPSVVQLNLSTCCSVPTDVNNFAKEHDIQVLTHSDSPEIIDDELVSTITGRLGLTGMTADVEWVARHRTIQRCYGTIEDKGYTVALNCHG